MPFLSVFALLAVCELFVVHLLLAAWSLRIALGISAATLLLFAVTGYFSLRAILRPVILTERGILLRSGGRAGLVLAYDNIEGVQDIAFRPEPKGRWTYRRTAMAHPNFLLSLRSPVAHRALMRTRPVRRVAIRVDDPAAFGLAVRARLV